MLYDEYFTKTVAILLCLKELRECSGYEYILFNTKWDNSKIKLFHPIKFKDKYYCI